MGRIRFKTIADLINTTNINTDLDVSKTLTVNNVLQDTAKDIWVVSTDNAITPFKTLTLLAGGFKIINAGNTQTSPLVVTTIGSGYGYTDNPNSYLYTVTVNGLYKIDANINFATNSDSLTNYTCFMLFVNGTATRFCSKNARLKDRMTPASINAIVQLSAGDTFSLRLKSEEGVVLEYDNCTLTMNRLRTNI